MHQSADPLQEGTGRLGYVTCMQAPSAVFRVLLEELILHKVDLWPKSVIVVTQCSSLCHRWWTPGRQAQAGCHRRWYGRCGSPSNTRHVCYVNICKQLPVLGDAYALRVFGCMLKQAIAGVHTADV